MNKQKIIVLDIDQQTEQFLIDKIAQGFVLHQITNLNPTFNKLLIIYYEPEPEPEPEQ